MIGYCHPCAKKIQVPLRLGMIGVPGTCAICAQLDDVHNETAFGPGREKLNAAALAAKLRRAEALPRERE